ncbi:unnamed protein product [Lampetra planeri]
MILIDHNVELDVNLKYAVDGHVHVVHASTACSGASEEESTEPRAIVHEDSDDELSKSDVDGNVSKMHFSQIKGDREYSPEEIHHVLQSAFRKRGAPAYSTC